jgi:Flp pilus assembly pilin Flp
MKSKIKNQKGQSLVEYLIIVALMAAAAIGVVRVLSQNTRAQFANVANALQGKSERKVDTKEVRESDYNFRDMGEFINGSSSRE